MADIRKHVREQYDYGAGKDIENVSIKMIEKIKTANWPSREMSKDGFIWLSESKVAIKGRMKFFMGRIGLITESSKLNKG